MENKSNGGLMVNHRATIAERKEFLVNNELMADVVFMVGKDQQKIYAHKQLLVAASDYFFVMLKGDFRESKADAIRMEDIEGPIFLEILRHIYCGKIDLNNENIREIFIHSKKFLLPELLGEVSDFFVQNVTSESALENLSQNRFYEFQDVDEKCLEFIGDNPFKYFSSEDFARIDRDSLEVIVKIGRINCSDWQLLKALQHWQKANPDENVDKFKAHLKRTARIYRCQKWQLFGSIYEYGRADQHNPQKIAVRSSVYLYGIGVIARNGGILIRIEKPSRNSILCEKKYDVDETNSQDIIDCFFPPCVLKPGEYWIYLSGDGLTKSITSPKVLQNDTIEFIKPNGQKPVDTNISCLFCDYGKIV